MTYPVGGLDDSKVEPATTGGSTMRVFLSLPNLSPKYEEIVEELRERGLTVTTNCDTPLSSDARLNNIRKSDAYVYFSSASHPILREVEFGYALGLGLPVAYVGKPETKLHRFGDVFDDTDDFLSWWYSGDYLRFVATFTKLREREKAIA